MSEEVTKGPVTSDNGGHQAVNEASLFDSLHLSTK